MAKVEWSAGIDSVSGALAKPSKEGQHSCDKMLLGTHRTAATTSDKCTRLYLRKQKKRSTPVTNDELARQTRFAAVAQAVTARMQDPVKVMVGVRHNYSYFPIFVDEQHYGISRDALYEKMKENNVLGRRYFYPLITDFEPYKDIPSANPANLPIANKVANQVICLPMHHALSDEDVKRVVECIRGK